MQKLINVFNHLNISDIEKFLNFIKNKAYDFYILIDFKKLWKLFNIIGISYYKSFKKSLKIKYTNDIKRFNYLILSFLSENDYI